MLTKIARIAGRTLVVAQLAALGAASVPACGSAAESVDPAGTGGAGGSRPELPPVELCAQRATQGLCATLPHDVLFEASANGYSGLVPRDQRPFDNFSWQTFVALNWPAHFAGTPPAETIGAEGGVPRVWQTYPTMSEVFGERHGDPAACEGVGRGDEPILEYAFLQGTGQPLIDRNRNFVMYETRMNPVEAAYIRDSGLDTQTGQRAFFAEAGNRVSFPLGYYDDPAARTGGAVGAIETKAAWRIIDTAHGDDPSRYFTVERRVLVPADSSASRRDFCFAAKLGLVGFHVMTRTTTKGQPQDWIWSTFEHVDNAPLAATPTEQTAHEMDECRAPAGLAARYSFFDAGCQRDGKPCLANAPPPFARHYRWSTTAPYARAYGEFGTQVVRCWNDYPETEQVNAEFQRALAGTPWANYRLVNTQWDAHGDGYPVVPKPTPERLANSVAETYAQGSSSCTTCHASATALGRDANFSFLLGHAR